VKKKDLEWCMCIDQEVFAKCSLEWQSIQVEARQKACAKTEYCNCGRSRGKSKSRIAAATKVGGHQEIEAGIDTATKEGSKQDRQPADTAANNLPAKSFAKAFFVPTSCHLRSSLRLLFLIVSIILHRA
jgi:hypothetical protein